MSRARTIKKTLFLSENEQKLINKKMAECHTRNFSHYARSMMCRGKFVIRDYSYLKSYLSELGKISRALNGIYNRINSTNNIYKDDIKEIRKAQQEVKRQVQRTVTLIHNKERDAEIKERNL